MHLDIWNLPHWRQYLLFSIGAVLATILSPAKSLIVGINSKSVRKTLLAKVTGDLSGVAVICVTPVR